MTHVADCPRGGEAKLPAEDLGIGYCPSSIEGADGTPGAKEVDLNEALEAGGAADQTDIA